MATGVVKGVGGGAGGGTLIVANPDSGGTGGTDPRVGATTTTIPGTEVAFTSNIPVAVGDHVQFDSTADGANVTAKLSAGTLITGVRDQPVAATATNAVLISGATCTGKITSNNGVVVISGNSVIDSKVDIDNNSTVVIGTGVKINGKVDCTNGNRIYMQSATVDGKTTSTGDKYISIKGCTIDGKLEVTTVPAEGCSITGNTVNGKVVVPPDGCRVG